MDDESLFRMFEEHLSIDRNDLDMQIQIQPDLIYQVTHRTNVANADVSAKKDEIAEQSAKLFLEAKQNGDSDSIANNKVRANEAIKLLNTQLRVLRDAAERWSALKDAILSRSYMLRELVNLYSADYFTSATTMQPRANYRAQLPPVTGRRDQYAEVLKMIRSRSAGLQQSSD